MDENNVNVTEVVETSEVTEVAETNDNEKGEGFGTTLGKVAAVTATVVLTKKLINWGGDTLDQLRYDGIRSLQDWNEERKAKAEEKKAERERRYQEKKAAKEAKKEGNK